jgi:multiple sugar transport system permease protein
MSAWKLALLSALTLTVLWLLAPSRSAQAPEPGVVEISYMGPGGPISGAMDDAIREFEEQSRAEHAKDPSRPIYRVVSGQNASRNQTEDPTRFLVSVAGGMPPDVIYFDRYAVSEWASRGAFTPLDEYIAQDAASGRPDAVKAEDYFPSCWDEAVFTNPLTGERKVFGIPNKVDNRVLFYNKDLLQRAGYSAPPQTWEELEVMAVKLTETDDKGRILRLGFVPNYGNSWLYIYGWMNGGEFMSADGKTCTLNDPKIVEALEWMTRVYDKLGGIEKVNAFQSSFQGGDLDPFLTGKIVMKISGFWELSDTFAQFGRNVNWACAPPPMPAAEVAKGRTTLSWVGGWCYAIPATAKNKTGAWELIRFLSSQRALEIINESTRLTVESQGRVFVPTQHSNRKLNDWQFDKYVIHNPSMDAKVAAGVKVFNDLLPDARYRPVTPVGQVLWNQQKDRAEDAFYHKLTAMAALDYGTEIVQRDLDRVLAPPRGKLVNWNLFFILYGVLLIGAAVGVYVWDTNEKFRTRFGERFVKKGGDLEGVFSPLFRSQWKGGWLCASPWIVGFVVFTGGPILFSIVISFCDFDILNPARFIGLTNYRWMFDKDPLFWKSMWNTMFMVIGVPLGMAISLGIAMLLVQKVRAVAMWRTFFYLPSIVPAVASSILWIWIFNPNGGLLNNVLASFNIHGPNWLQDENTSKLSLILMGLWGAGGGMIIWIAGLKGISESYYEAASLDGANKWQQFLHVTLPLLSPYIFFNLIMGLIGTFQIFTQAFIMTQGGPVNSTLFYAYHLFNNAFRYLQMGYAAAMAWVLFLIVFALTVIQLKLQKRWVHYEEG